MRTIHLILLLATASSFLVTSCKDKDPNEIISDIYFQATIDGEIRTYQYDVDDYINIVGDFAGGQDAGSENQFIPFTCVASEDALTSSSGLNNSGAVGVIITSTSNLNPEQVGDEIASGALSYGTRSYEAQTDAIPGAFVSWVDGNGTEWTSNGDQTDSNFNITVYVDEENDESNSHKTFGADFNCMLYNGQGGSIILNDGKVRGRLIVY